MRITCLVQLILLAVFMYILGETIVLRRELDMAKHEKQHMNTRDTGISTSKDNTNMNMSGTRFNISSGQYPQNVVNKTKNIPKSQILPGLDIVLTKKSLATFIDLIEIFVEICEHNKIEYMMYGGTLIGSYRHHGPVPWDDDMDFWIPYSQLDVLEKAVSKYTYKYKYVRGYGNRSKFFSYESNTRPKGSLLWNWPYLDIFYYVKNETHVWDSYKNFGDFNFKNDDVFPLTRRPFLHMMLNAPYKTESVLTKTYNIQTCQRRVYDHKNEVGERSIKNVPCEKLHKYYPFVFRANATKDNILKEVLEHSGKIIQEFSFHSTKGHLLTFWRQTFPDLITYFTI